MSWDDFTACAGRDGEILVEIGEDGVKEIAGLWRMLPQDVKAHADRRRPVGRGVPGGGAGSGRDRGRRGHRGGRRGRRARRDHGRDHRLLRPARDDRTDRRGSRSRWPCLLVSAGAPKLWRPGHVAGALRRVFGPRTRTTSLRHYGPAARARGSCCSRRAARARRRRASLAVAARGHVPRVPRLRGRGRPARRVVRVLGVADRGARRRRRTGPHRRAGGRRGVRWPSTGVARAGVSVADLGWALACCSPLMLAGRGGRRPVRARAVGGASHAGSRGVRHRPGWAVLARLVFLAGFVHIGTDAEPRRAHRLPRRRPSAAAQRTRCACRWTPHPCRPEGQGLSLPFTSRPPIARNASIGGRPASLSTPARRGDTAG